jgi:hypothetical protein
MRVCGGRGRYVVDTVDVGDIVVGLVDGKFNKAWTGNVETGGEGEVRGIPTGSGAMVVFII